MRTPPLCLLLLLSAISNCVGWTEQHNFALDSITDIVYSPGRGYVLNGHNWGGVQSDKGPVWTNDWETFYPSNLTGRVGDRVQVMLAPGNSWFAYDQSKDTMYTSSDGRSFIPVEAPETPYGIQAVISGVPRQNIIVAVEKPKPTPPCHHPPPCPPPGPRQLSVGCHITLDGETWKACGNVSNDLGVRPPAFNGYNIGYQVVNNSNYKYMYYYELNSQPGGTNEWEYVGENSHPYVTSVSHISKLSPELSRSGGYLQVAANRYIYYTDFKGVETLIQTFDNNQLDSISFMTCLPNMCVGFWHKSYQYGLVYSLSPTTKNSFVVEDTGLTGYRLTTDYFTNAVWTVAHSMTPTYINTTTGPKPTLTSITGRFGVTGNILELYNINNKTLIAPTQYWKVWESTDGVNWAVQSDKASFGWTDVHYNGLGYTAFVQTTNTIIWTTDFQTYITYDFPHAINGKKTNRMLGADVYNGYLLVVAYGNDVKYNDVYFGQIGNARNFWRLIGQVSRAYSSDVFLSKNCILIAGGPGGVETAPISAATKGSGTVPFTSLVSNGNKFDLLYHKDDAFAAISIRNTAATVYMIDNCKATKVNSGNWPIPPGSINYMGFTRSANTKYFFLFTTASLDRQMYISEDMDHFNTINYPESANDAATAERPVLGLVPGLGYPQFSLIVTYTYGKNLQYLS